MRLSSLGWLAIAGFVAMLGVAAPASAQATRTWVSGTGDDANPCSRTAPCKTFAGAINKTAVGGEINTLDPAGYGAVTITKSIAIVSDLANGGILNSFTSGIVINAPGGIVRIAGVEVQGGGSGGIRGVRIVDADSVTLENVIIMSQTLDPGYGIEVAPTTGPARVYIKDTTITNNKVGLRVDGSAAAAQAILEDVSIVRNRVAGIQVSQAATKVFLNRSAVTQNLLGIAVSGGGTILSYGTNILDANGTDGVVPTPTPLR